jgi:hypothetical protein
MTDILTATWQLVGSLLGNIADIFVTTAGWLYSVLLILHNDMPRLEGLLLGVLFAWFFVHRDKNPLIRALSSPLKILLDILDIIWDETMEAGSDLCGTVKNYIVNAATRVKDFVVGVFSSGVNRLKALKDRLASKSKEE